MSEAKKLADDRGLPPLEEPAVDLTAGSSSSQSGPLAGISADSSAMMNGQIDEGLPHLPPGLTIAPTIDAPTSTSEQKKTVGTGDTFLDRLNRILIVMLWGLAAAFVGLIAGIGAAAVVLAGILDKNSAWLKQGVNLVKEVIRYFA